MTQERRWIFDGSEAKGKVQLTCADMKERIRSEKFRHNPRRIEQDNAKGDTNETHFDEMHHETKTSCNKA